MGQHEPVKRLLLSWSDRGVEGPSPPHRTERPADRGPVLRLLEESDPKVPYDHARLLTGPKGVRRARFLADDMRRYVGMADVLTVDVEDPSDYPVLFKKLVPLAAQIEREFPSTSWEVDVLLSAGTPQVQTIWVILVQAALLKARLLQVIPAAFVPHPHPLPIRVSGGQDPRINGEIRGGLSNSFGQDHVEGHRVGVRSSSKSSTWMTTGAPCYGTIDGSSCPSATLGVRDHRGAVRHRGNSGNRDRLFEGRVA